MKILKLRTPPILDYSIKITEEGLISYYDRCKKLLDKYYKINRGKYDELRYTIKCIPKEFKLLELGYDTVLLEDDIRYEKYIGLHKTFDCEYDIIPIKEYSKIIPNKILKIIEETKEIFDNNFCILLNVDHKGNNHAILIGMFEYDSTTIKMYCLDNWIEEGGINLSKLIKQNSIKKSSTTKDEIISECKN